MNYTEIVGAPGEVERHAFLVHPPLTRVAMRRQGSAYHVTAAIDTGHGPVELEARVPVAAARAAAARFALAARRMVGSQALPAALQTARTELSAGCQHACTGGLFGDIVGGVAGAIAGGAAALIPGAGPVIAAVVAPVVGGAVSSALGGSADSKIGGAIKTVSSVAMPGGAIDTIGQSMGLGGQLSTALGAVADPLGLGLSKVIQGAGAPTALASLGRSPVGTAVLKALGQGDLASALRGAGIGADTIAQLASGDAARALGSMGMGQVKAQLAGVLQGLSGADVAAVLKQLGPAGASRAVAALQSLGVRPTTARGKASGYLSSALRAPMGAQLGLEYGGVSPARAAARDQAVARAIRQNPLARATATQLAKLEQKIAAAEGLAILRDRVAAAASDPQIARAVGLSTVVIPGSGSAAVALEKAATLLGKIGRNDPQAVSAARNLYASQLAGNERAKRALLILHAVRNARKVPSSDAAPNPGLHAARAASARQWIRPRAA